MSGAVAAIGAAAGVRASLALVQHAASAAAVGWFLAMSARSCAGRHALSLLAAEAVTARGPAEAARLLQAGAALDRALPTGTPSGAAVWVGGAALSGSVTVLVDALGEVAVAALRAAITGVEAGGPVRAALLAGAHLAGAVHALAVLCAALAPGPAHPTGDVARALEALAGLVAAPRAALRVAGGGR
jgi:hypothetical protein